MKYEECEPSAWLAPFVERIWAFELEAHDPASVQHVVVPDGGSNLTVVATANGTIVGASLTGPRDSAFQITVYQGVQYRGLRIRAGALRPFLGVSPATVIGKNEAIQSFQPELFVALRSELTPLKGLQQFAVQLDKFFQDRASLVEQPDSSVCALVLRLEQDHTDESLGKLMKTNVLSERQLRRRFVAETGLTPKVYSRLRRVRRACAHLAQDRVLGLADIAIDHGYADQPHFTRELQAVFGMSPLLLGQYLRQIQHLMVVELQRLT